MNETEQIQAALKLSAVLQNAEELVRLDQEMTQQTKAWNVVIQFVVRNGPCASLSFADGMCTHALGRHPRPNVTLLCLSAKHLNAVFDDGASPIPLKGLTRLGFLKNEFGALTDRLEHFLRPTEEKLRDETYMRINTIMTMNTAAYAAKVLAELEPASRTIATRIGKGTLLMEVQPDGPMVTIECNGPDMTVRKGGTENPTATLSFRDLGVAADILNGRVDPFLAVANGDVALRGMINKIDELNLILDRVPLYLA